MDGVAPLLNEVARIEDLGEFGEGILVTPNSCAFFCDDCRHNGIFITADVPKNAIYVRAKALIDRQVGELRFGSGQIAKKLRHLVL
jgi:hypothetical protein